MGRPRKPPPALTAAGQALVAANVGLAHQQAYRYAWGLVYRHGQHVYPNVKYHANQYYEELIGAAMTGLCLAAGKFDPARGCKFCTLAVHWIRQAVQRAAKQSQLCVGGCNPRGRDVVPVYSLEGQHRSHRGAHDESEPLDVLDDRGDEEGPAEPAPTVQALLALLLNPREQRLVRGHALDGQGYAALGARERPQISKERVRQVLQKALAKLSGSAAFVKALQAQVGRDGAAKLLGGVGTRIA